MTTNPHHARQLFADHLLASIESEFQELTYFRPTFQSNADGFNAIECTLASFKANLLHGTPLPSKSSLRAHAIRVAARAMQFAFDLTYVEEDS